jgi:AraC family transcriptional regulator, transcriptional activator of pobA
MNQDRISSVAPAGSSNESATEIRQLHARRLSSDNIPDGCVGWHRHPYFEVYWITNGTGEHLNDFETHLLTPGTLVFISMGQFHSWRFSRDVRGFMLRFSSSEISGTAPRLDLHDELPFFFGPKTISVSAVPKDDQSEITRDFEALLAEVESEDALSADAAHALFRLLLIRCQRVCRGSGGFDSRENAGVKLARRFWWELNAASPQLRHVKDYAARLQVTVNHLVETVREQFGRTPGELIDERLYFEARRLLLHTTRSVSEIAYLLDFKAPSHFCAFFRRYANCSPGEVRRAFEERASRTTLRGDFTQSIERDTELVNADMVRE